ncbi:MAG: 16S rRNA (guanine(527)-N(7))-methyltransferase RsmG [Acidobacteria bacterium]|nr:16S rRNA (guanine(527)-N(7))-methyltransferase RsmG [Acidobacteriota bacterium]
MDKDQTRADEFSNALTEYAPRYDVQLTADGIARLRAYYEQVVAWNTRLHLVAPCSPAEFATRHVLESLLALAHLSNGVHVVDIGSGAGLPVIPCLIVRPDLRVSLIESSPKKAVFLREALRRVGAHGPAQVIAERFEKLTAPEADYVTCRALDRFTEMFTELVEWSPRNSTLLFFGGDSLREQIEKAALVYEAIRIPESERRFLFIIKRGGL